jgi:hypothetical protein
MPLSLFSKVTINAKRILFLGKGDTTGIDPQRERWRRSDDNPRSAMATHRWG